MLFWFIVKVIALVAALIFVCYKKGESPRWQWGSSGKMSDWARYQSTPFMRKVQLVLLVMIIIGLALIFTQNLWVGGVVDFILKNFN